MSINHNITIHQRLEGVAIATASSRLRSPFRPVRKPSAAFDGADVSLADVLLTEGMACRTPVRAYIRCLAQKTDKVAVTGLIVSNVLEAVAATRRVQTVGREAVWTRLETRFTAGEKARDCADGYGSRATWTAEPRTINLGATNRNSV